MANRGAHRSLSNIESASTNVNGSESERSNGSTSYHSSTLPLRKQRNKISIEEKNKKVCAGVGPKQIVGHGGGDSFFVSHMTISGYNTPRQFEAAVQ